MEMIETADAFKAKVDAIQGGDTYKAPLAFGICRVDFGQLNSDKILQATYPVINWDELRQRRDLYGSTQRVRHAGRYRQR